MQKRRFTKEFEAEAVRLARTSGRTQREVADDLGIGLSYHQYVSELTYLLFLKIAEENGMERHLPSNCRWKDLAEHPDDGLLGFYQEMLTHLGTSADSEVIQAIYAFPTTVFSHAENLRAVIDGIAKIDWHDLSNDRFGQIYEGRPFPIVDRRQPPLCKWPPRSRGANFA